MRTFGSIITAIFMLNLSTGIAFAQDPKPLFDTFDSYLITQEIVDSGYKWQDYYESMLNIALQFDGICGDTFCEGDYPDLILRDDRCVIDLQNKMIKSCLFLFHGLYSSVNGATGNLEVEEKTYQCPLLLQDISEKTWYDFILKVGSAGNNYIDGIWKEDLLIPGQNQTLYEFFGSCFN